MKKITKSKQILLKLYPYQYEFLTTLAKSLRVTPQECLRSLLTSKICFDNLKELHRDENNTKTE